MKEFLSDGLENTVGKEENDGHEHFIFFPQCFQKPAWHRSYKLLIVWQFLLFPLCFQKLSWQKSYKIKNCVVKSKHFKLT